MRCKFLDDELLSKFFLWCASAYSLFWLLPRTTPWLGLTPCVSLDTRKSPMSIPGRTHCCRSSSDGHVKSARRANHRFPVQPHLQKYSASRFAQIKSISPAVPFPLRGVSRSSQTLGAGCGGRC